MNTIAGLLVLWLTKRIGFNSAQAESRFIFITSFICYFANTSLLATHSPYEIQFGMSEYYIFYGTMMVSAVFWTSMTANLIIVYAMCKKNKVRKLIPF